MNEIEKHIRDINDLEFKGVKGSISVSKILRALTEEFDKEGISANLVKKHFDNPDSKYYHMTQEQILAQWEEKANVSKEIGRISDNFIESYYCKSLEENLKYFDNYPNLENYFNGFLKFDESLKSKLGYQYACREVKVFYRCGDFIVNGRFDCCYDKENSALLIIDWKTNASIEEKNNFGKKMLGPCFSLDDCSLNQYSIQVQIYKRAFIDTYHIDKDIQTYIVQLGAFNESNKANFKVYKAKEFSKQEIDSFIQFACKKLS